MLDKMYRISWLVVGKLYKLTHIHCLYRLAMYIMDCWIDNDIIVIDRMKKEKELQDEAL